MENRKEKYVNLTDLLLKNGKDELNDHLDKKIEEQKKLNPDGEEGYTSCFELNEYRLKEIFGVITGMQTVFVANYGNYEEQDFIYLIGKTGSIYSYEGHECSCGFYSCNDFGQLNLIGIRENKDEFFQLIDMPLEIIRIVKEY